MGLGKLRTKPTNLGDSMGLKAAPVLRWQGKVAPDAEERAEKTEVDSLQLSGSTGRDDPTGQPSSSAQNPSPTPFPRYEIRVVSRDDQGRLKSLDFPQMLRQNSGHSQTFFPWTISQTDIKDYAGLAPTAGDRAVMPKDHSVRLTAVELSLCSEPSQRFFEQLSQIGEIEDFHVVGLTTGSTSEMDAGLKSRGYQNYALHSAEAAYAWLEDSSESLEGGVRLMSASLESTQCTVQDILESGREERLGELAKGLKGEYQGGVQKARTQRMAAAQALVHGQPVRQGKSYLEGGNLLSGTRQDGSAYVLVGADSLEIAWHQLKQSKPGATLEEAKAIVASDLGVAVEQLYSIEQPGAFHLDMRMMPIGPGKMALQDSREAAALHLEWLRQEGVGGAQLDRMAEKLENWVNARAPLEDLAARDLQAAGLEVHRLAGVFLNFQERDSEVVNFFNSRHGVSPQGVRYTILMGGPPQAESYFATQLLEQIKAPIDRLYFLDPSQTEPTLKLMGGLKCRSKLLGQRAAHQVATEFVAGPASQGLQLALAL